MSAGCTGPDDTVDLFLRELIQGDIKDKNLVPNALHRYGLLEEVALGSLCSFNQTTFDHLIEAFETFSFGFFRSSIFCCASIVDFKLKEVAEKYGILKGPGDKPLEECNLSETIKLLKKIKETDPFKDKSLRKLLDNAIEINKIKNKVAIHPTIAGAPDTCDSDECDTSGRMGTSSCRDTKNSTWLANLALKSINTTSDILSTRVLSNSSIGSHGGPATTNLNRSR